MTEELNRLRQEARRTCTVQEREESSVKQDQLQAELDLRNVQISELQQQILGLEQEKEKEAKSDRWAKLTSMVEAKLAAQYLFDQATSAMASDAVKAAELKEVAHQYEEIREDRNELREQLNRVKMSHEDQLVRLEREHEEKVLFLLRQLPGEEVPETRDVSLDPQISNMEKTIKFQAEEIAKMSALHDQLMVQDTKIATLEDELKRGSRMSLMPKLGPYSPVKKDKKRVTIAVERVTEEEFFSSSEESSEEDESSDSDPEWRKTPMFKRIVKERRSLAESNFKRKRGSDAEEYEKDMKPERKKSGGSGSKEGKV